MCGDRRGRTWVAGRRLFHRIKSHTLHTRIDVDGSVLAGIWGDRLADLSYPAETNAICRELSRQVTLASLRKAN